jgi:hypothetical protein
MTYKWNLEVAQRYSAQVAQLLSNRFFSEHTYITGPQIIQFTELKALNWLILKQLFSQWENEIRRWKSPYFDYSVLEVQEAQQVFFNRASQHILIQHSDYQPLIQKALTELLALILSPADFFQWQGGAKALTASWWEKNNRYVLIQIELCQQLQSLGTNVDNTRLHSLISSYATPSTAEVFIPIWEQLASWQPLPSEFSPPPMNAQFATTSQTATSFFDQFAPGDHIPRVPAKPVDYVEKEKERMAGPRNLNDTQTTPPSVGDLHQKSKITSIMGTLSINQKFTFINQLFQGDAQVFKETVEDLENSSDFQGARNKLVKKYVPRFIWDVTAPELEHFFDMVERRFK